MKYSAQLEWFINLAAEGDIVPAFRDRPHLQLGSQDAWNAFWTLSETRALYVGMGGSHTGFIPFSDLIGWFYIYPMAMDERRRFIRIMKRLDNEFVKLVNDRPKTVTGE